VLYRLRLDVTAASQISRNTSDRNQERCRSSGELNLLVWFHRRSNGNAIAGTNKGHASPSFENPIVEHHAEALAFAGGHQLLSRLQPLPEKAMDIRVPQERGPHPK